jgi:hypothetical protein
VDDDIDHGSIVGGEVRRSDKRQFQAELSPEAAIAASSVLSTTRSSRRAASAASAV